LDKTKNTNT